MLPGVTAKKGQSFTPSREMWVPSCSPASRCILSSPVGWRNEGVPQSHLKVKREVSAQRRLAGVEEGRKNLGHLSSPLPFPPRESDGSSLRPNETLSFSPPPPRLPEKPGPWGLASDLQS